MHETVGVYLVEQPRPLAARHVELDIAGKDVGMEGYGDRLRVGEDRLRPVEVLPHPRQVVDDNQPVAELGAQLRHDVHAVLRDVLQRRPADRQGRVESDHVDGRNVVQLRVGDAAGAQLGRRAGRRQTARDAA